MMHNPIAQKILDALRQRPADTMSRWDITNLFSRNQSSEKIGEALALLLKHDKVSRIIRKPDGPGRPKELLIATSPWE
jgi:hypothetical protein